MYACALCGRDLGEDEPDADTLVQMAVDLERGLLQANEPIEVVCDDCYALVELHQQTKPAPTGPKKLIFAPGCFDEFDGPPEELQSLIAAIHQANQDGTMFKDATRLTEEEQADVDRRVAEAAKRRARPQ